MKKKRLRLKTPFRIILSVIAIILIVTLYFPISSIVKLMNHDYSFFSSIEIYKKDLFDEVIDKEYSQMLDNSIRHNDFDITKFDSYMIIDYYDKKDFLITVNKLIDFKYSIDDINKINSVVSDEFINILLEEYVYDIGKYLDIKYFKEENFERYKTYFNGSYEKTVLYVNIGLDKEYYTDVNINDKFSTTMIINKYNGVSSKFKVPELIKISDDCSVDDENYLASEAAVAFEKMCKEAKKDGYLILANSTYRDYEIQQQIWDKYLDLYGQSYNDKYITKPGFSEHHTGLAVDVKSANNNIFKNSKEYIWMKENSYKYGFIHRYQESKVDITGIASEAWHFRYVGVDIATYIYEHNLSFEEYYAMFLEK